MKHVDGAGVRLAPAAARGVQTRRSVRPAAGSTRASEAALFDYCYKRPQLTGLASSEADWHRVFNEERYLFLRDWATMTLELRASRCHSVSAAEAHAAAGPARRGPSLLDAWRGGPPLLLDVRDAASFARGAPAGATSLPLYPQLPEPADDYGWARVVAFAPPEHSAAFVAAVARLVGGNRKTPVFVLCSSETGSLESAEERRARDPQLPLPLLGEYGAPCRALLALHELAAYGLFENLAHVQGGYAAWVRQGLPLQLG